MRFSSYNMEGRIKSKTKFINEGVAECFNSVKYNNHYMLNKHDIDIFEIWNNYDSYDRNYSNFIACKFCTKLLEQGGKDNFLKLIYEQTISKAEEISLIWYKKWGGKGNLIRNWLLGRWNEKRKKVQ